MAQKKAKASPKKKSRATDRNEVVVEETEVVQRAEPVIVERKPATLAQALTERAGETVEPEVERTVVRKRRRVA